MCSYLEWQLNVDPLTLFFHCQVPLSHLPFCMLALSSCASDLPGSLWLATVPLLWALFHQVSPSHVHFSFWLTAPPSLALPSTTLFPVGPFHRPCPSSDADLPIGDVGGMLPTPMFNTQCDNTYSNKLWCFTAHPDAFLFLISGGPPLCFFVEYSTHASPTWAFFFGVDLSSSQPAPMLAAPAHAGPFQQVSPAPFLLLWLTLSPLPTSTAHA